MKTIPESVTSLIGVEQYEEESEIVVERGAIENIVSSVENGSPLYWDEDVAKELTGGWIAPPTSISAWSRPHWWAPGRTEQKLPLQVHFDLKKLLDVPDAIMSQNTLIFHEPVRPGDRITTVQVLRNVSEEKTLKLGTGHFWDIDLEYRNQDGELCARESITGFGYRKEAR